MRWWRVAWAAVAVGVVLRVWGIGGQDLTFDEAFTGAAARRSAPDLFRFLRENDTHPPLDYLVRIPFASFGNELLLRLPSAVFSVGALVLVAWWMRGRGPFGAFTTLAAALMPFAVMHGREARMYAVVMLLGVVAAMASERWLRTGSIIAACVVGVAGLLAVLSQSAALVMVGALVLVPGLRRDGPAWVFRGAVVGALLVWAAIWGPSFREQASVVSSFWIPLTTFDSLRSVGAVLVSPRSALLTVSFGFLLLGTVALLVRGGPLARVSLFGFVVPFVTVAALGVELHVFLARSFAFSWWAVAAAVGAALDWMRRRAGGRGAAVGVAFAVTLLLPPSLDLARTGREQLVAMDVLRERLEQGDRISISPAWFRPLLQWNFVAKRGFEVIGGDTDGRFVVIDASRPPSGRTHLLDHTQLPRDDAPFDGAEACKEPFQGSSWLLRCVREP